MIGRKRGLKRAPWPLFGAAGCIGLLVILPIFYLILRAFEAEWAELAAIVFRWRNVRLLWNTMTLAAAVLAVTSAIALPLAWISARIRIRGGRLITLLGLMPLAIPPYLMAYGYLALGGSQSPTALFLGVELPRISGFGGSLLALSICFFPYLYLNLRSALMGLDPALEEVAKSLGYSPLRVACRVVLPQLRPAYSAGALLVLLHVMSDFGVVSLMRYETFSYALYLQYMAAFDRTYAAWLGLFLLMLTAVILVFEARFLRRLFLYRVSSGAARVHQARDPGMNAVVVYGFVGLVFLFSLAAPIGSILFWFSRGAGLVALGDVGRSLWHSLSVSAPAALVAAGLASPLAYLGVRYPTPTARILERTAYLGYATPALAVALGLVFFALNTAPILYQTRALLVYALAIHFLAEAMGPIRSAVYQARPQLEESARALGLNPVQAFMRATFPLLRRGLITGMAFVFLSSMKELPLTFILSPLDYHTLAVNVWGHIDEAMFAQAAPYALTILVFSGLFVGLLQTQERNRR